MENARKPVSLIDFGKSPVVKDPIFTVKSEQSFLSEVDSCYHRLIEFMELWTNLDMAGINLTESYFRVLKGTQYESISMDSFTTYKQIDKTNAVIVSEAREMESLMRGLKCTLETGDRNDRSLENTQILCHCLLLLVKMQIAYHRICTEELNLLVKKCVQDIGLGGGQTELLQSLASLYIQTPSESAISQSEQGRSSDKNTEKPLDKSPTATSPKSQSKSRASGFFSLFGKRSTSSEARSSFYVNNPNKSSNANPIEQKSSHLTPAIVPLDFPRSPTTSVSPEHEQTPKEYSPCRIVDDEGMPRAPSAAYLATEEELDSVINLLSGCSSAAPSYMQAIPETLTPPASEANRVGTGDAATDMLTPTSSMSGFTVPTSFSNSTMLHENRQYIMHHQRRSEGSLDFSSMAHIGPNTWPHHHRVGAAGPPPSQYYRNDAGLARHYSEQHLPVQQVGYEGNQLLSNLQWSFPDNKLNRTWPSNNTALSREHDMMPPSWSGLQDSSDNSDDSSSGEQFFAVGLDLVHAMDSRNESSDDEPDGAADPNFRPPNVDINTWSPNNPWGRQADHQDIESCDLNNQSQKGMQIQWTDPVTSRHMWSAAGLPPPTQPQSVHGFHPLQ